MIIRKIKPEELKRCAELFAISFEFPMENSEESSLALYEKMKNNTHSRQDQYCLEKWAAFEDDDETMMSFFGSVPYPANFDGNTCIMTGIGGVATLPPYRRRGGIRACFVEALKDMYLNNVDFSYLYPFSTSYYKKFGYGICAQKVQYQVLMSEMNHFSVDGTHHLMDKNTVDFEGIKTIYASWQHKYNMMIVNEDYEFGWLHELNPYKTQEFTYIYRNASGQPLAYTTFKKVDEPSGRNLHCTRFVFSNLEGLYGLFNLLNTLAGDHMYLFFDLPEDIMLYAILPEWSKGCIARTILPYGMARVVNVEKVLKMAKYNGSGTCKIKVTDKYIQENSKIFELTFHDNVATTITETSDAPDISLDISDFSRLIIGTITLDDYYFYANKDLPDNQMNLRKIFYKKPVYISEYF